MPLFKRNAHLLFLLALVLLLLPAVGLAQTDDSADSALSAILTVEQDTASDPITVGDVITLTLRVTHPAGWRVIIPTLEANWGDLEVVQQGLPVISDNADGSEMTTQQIDARLFAPGEYQTLPLTLTVVDDQGITQPYPVAPVDVTVVSVLVEGDTELRDIKPQASFVITNQTNPLPFVAGAGVLGLGALAAVIVWRKRAARPTVATRTPLERASAALDGLAALELADTEAIKAFYAAVSQIVRRYLGEALAQPLLDQTTAQIRGVLQATGIPEETTRAAVKLLKACDEVKFAPDVPAVESPAQFATRAREVVTAIDRTLPRVEEVAA